MPSTWSPWTIGAQIAARSPQYSMVSNPAVAASMSSSGYEHSTSRCSITRLEPGGVGEAVGLADPVDVVLVGDPRPERLRAQDTALGVVLVDAALGALERFGDLLGELDQGVAEQGVLARAAVVHQSERRARALVVVHGPHPLAGRGIGSTTYGLNGTFVAVSIVTMSLRVAAVSPSTVSSNMGKTSRTLRMVTLP